MSDKKEFSRKKKQWMIAIGAIAALLILSVVAVTLSQPSTPDDMQAVDAAPDDMEPKDIAIPGDSVSDSDVWITKSESSMQNMMREISELKQQLQTLKAENNEREKNLKNQQNEAFSNNGLPSAPSAPINVPAFIPNMGPESINQSRDPFNEPKHPQQAINETIPPAFNNTPQAPQPKGILLVRMERPKNDQTEPSKKDKKTWLGIGFSQARLLNGLDAATGGQAQKNPQPVLLQITDMTTMANHFKENYKECFITAGGYGDISSERAYLRLEKLSCIGETGQAIEENIDGYITGPDGKVGVRGRLVSKQGLVLAKALLAGIAAGIGDAFTQANSTQTVSPLGVTSTITPGSATKAGLYNGVGTAMQKLADFYIQQANKLYPIIEVAAGQTVDVIIKNGTTIPNWRGKKI